MCLTCQKQSKDPFAGLVGEHAADAHRGAASGAGPARAAVTARLAEGDGTRAGYGVKFHTMAQATQGSEWVHAAQRVSFLAASLLFWWSFLSAHGITTAGGAAILYLSTTALHSGFLGAKLTFARQVWYPGYGTSVEAWGVAPLEDQQLGWLILWIPACTAYFFAALFVMLNCWWESERIARQREAADIALVAS
jgi:cytochrome c oxidase assembly factor CtaG